MANDFDLESGIAAHRDGRLDEAALVYRAVLAQTPDHPDALHYLGLLFHQHGNSEEGAALIERALEIAPRQPAALSNLGNIYRLLGRSDDALRIYWSAVRLDYAHAEAWSNLANVLRNVGEPERALKAAEISCMLEPANFPARHVLALVHLDMAQYEKAAAVFRSCIADGLFEGNLPLLYVNMLNHCGRPDEALDVLEAWHAARPDSPTARYHLQAQRGADQPRAPDAYVRETFDNFAGNFDAALAGLEYGAPRLVVERAAALLGGRRVGDAVDLGCGTGLVGPLLKPGVQRLAGVDLSPKMLARADRTGAYDELVESEITTFLDEGPAERFELATAADVLNYFGELAPVLAAIGRALAPDAALIATFEVLAGETDNPGYRLATTGRYAHAEGYIGQAAKSAGLSIVASERVELRKEFDAMVEGFLVTFVKER